MKRYGTGCKKSKIDGTENIFKSNIALPSKFTLTPIMPPILDQGETPRCVAFSLVTCLDFNKNLSENDNNGEQYNINELYKMRSDPHLDGMDIKDGLHILKHTGLKSIDNHRIYKIRSYAKVNSCVHLKSALLLNGPCPVALPVRSYDSKFWRGKDILGYHCVVITGFDENGFEIRNSWGKSWGKNGYTYISFDDFNDNIIEIWTLFK